MGHWRVAPCSPSSEGPWALPFLAAPQLSYQLMPTPLLWARLPTQFRQTHGGGPTLPMGLVGLRENLTVSLNSSALPDSPPSIPHPQIPESENPGTQP